MKNYKLVAISAVSLDGVIGVGNDIPWHIPEDFKHFRNTTMGHPLIVGANTYHTLPDKGFENRFYYVINGGNIIENTRPNVMQFSGIDELFEYLNDRNIEGVETIFVAGGSMVYNSLIGDCDEAIITWVNKSIPNGNKFFPIDEIFRNFDTLNESEWVKSKSGITYKITHYVKSE